MAHHSDTGSAHPNLGSTERKTKEYDPDAIAPVPLHSHGSCEDAIIQLETESSHVGEYGTKRDLVRTHLTITYNC